MPVLGALTCGRLTDCFARRSFLDSECLKTHA